MDIEPIIYYWPNGKVELKFYYINNKFHRVDGPATINYYETGKIERENWYFNGIQHRIDGPAVIFYYESGETELEFWYLNDKELKNKELIEYKEWLTNNNLFSKSNINWTDEEKVLWRLTWV